MKSVETCLQNSPDLPMFNLLSTQHTTAVIQQYLNELNRAADIPAEPLVRNVLESSVARLHWLCELMLQRHYPRLMKGPVNLTADELLSGVVERLLKAMREIHPETVRQFFALANRQMRWELNDIARHLDAKGYASEFQDARYATSAPSTTGSHSTKARRILDAIEALPEDEREVFTLMRIQGMTRAETADVVGVAEKTVQRRLKRGLILLHQVLHDIDPAHVSTMPGAARQKGDQPSV